MIFRIIQPRWLFASAVVHAAVVGCGIAWFGFASRTATSNAHVTLELMREHETSVLEEEIFYEPVEDPRPLEEPTFVEVVPVDVPKEEAREECEIVEACDEPVPDERSPQDWLVVIRRRKPEELPTPPDRPVVLRTKVTPTPIVGENQPPHYPARAIRLGIHGTVVVSVDVDDEGRVLACRIETSSGSRLLDDVAARAVRKWQFRDGPGTVLIPIVFTLDRAR